jgi:hypothetical protein
MGPINGVAADVSMFSTSRNSNWGNNIVLSFGMDISNLGPKVSYIAGGQKYFLPTNLKMGFALTFAIDNDSEFTVTTDVNKLLVPTPPIKDSNGNIVQGKEDNRSVVSGIFGSFSDAPGGFREELNELSISPAVELLFLSKQFALRGGYFYESANKGNRQYPTAGIGYSLNKSLDFNFAYLFAAQDKSPLANTLRFSIILHSDGRKSMF